MGRLGVSRLRAYFDRSEVPKYGAVAVAGWLLSVEHWGRFEENWREVLRSFGVSRLHMAEYESGHGEFRGWPPENKKVFMRRLIGVLRQAGPLGVSVGLLRSDFESTLSEAQRRIVSAYGLCAVHAIGGMMRWVKDKGSREPIAFVFETGDVGAGQITSAIAKARRDNTEFDQHIDSLDFERKENAVWGLEAADFLAYEAAKHLPRLVGLDPMSPRRSLLRLLKRTQHVSMHLGADLLRKEFPAVP
jgi:hypothetical protein